MYLFILTGTYRPSISTSVWRVPNREFFAWWHDSHLGLSSYWFAFKFNARVTFLSSAHLYLCFNVELFSFFYSSHLLSTESGSLFWDDIIVRQLKILSLFLPFCFPSTLFSWCESDVFLYLSYYISSCLFSLSFFGFKMLLIGINCSIARSKPKSLQCMNENASNREICVCIFLVGPHFYGERSH